MADAKQAWWARALLIGSVVAAVCMPLGALGTKVGLWGFPVGIFGFLGAAAILAVVGLVVGFVCLIIAVRRGLADERKSTAVALVLCVLVLAVLGNQFMIASSYPAIHNISTDLDDPPQFSALLATREAASANPLDYDTATLEIHRAGYPELNGVVVSGSVQAVTARAVEVVDALGIEVVASDPSAGVVEGTATTFWFGFKDDVVVRVRAADDGGGSLVDVRSVSRVGQGDLGANARRISEILNGLEGV